MESMITILGPSFLPFFLILWLVLNISSSFFPPDVQQRFYRYGYTMPFYHNTQATKTITYSGKNHLGLNFGVSLAWAVVNVVAICAFTWIVRKMWEREEGMRVREKAAERAGVKEKAEEEV
ncbi:hypothetical protein YB2330_003401 [Saitoella coloradoensis]